MKKLIAILCAAVVAVSVMGCKNVAGEVPSKYKIGDIVLNDGSYLRDVDSVSDEDKEKAIAVIYKVSGSKAYGVGILHDRNGIEWCISSANGFEKVEAISCSLSGEEGNYTFTGDIDGSDNLSEIGKAFETDDTVDLSNYPAFEFAINYKNKTGSRVKGTAYENGWYLPSIAELFDIYLEIETVDSVLRKCDGTKFSGGWYWASSQDDLTGSCALDLCLADGEVTSYSKNTQNNYVCCIRGF